jgi:hypothetical protein
VDLPRSLAADLRALGVDLTATAYPREALGVLDRDLHRQVPSALGATITVTHAEVAECPMQINLVDRPVEPAEIAAALLIPLGDLAPPVTGHVVLYAGAAGAFAELVVALAAALDLAAGSFDQHPELPRSLISPGVTGFRSFAIVNRAVGVLVNRGRTVPEARIELRRRADQSRTGLPMAAQTLLDSV